MGKGARDEEVITCWVFRRSYFPATRRPSCNKNDPPRQGRQQVLGEAAEHWSRRPWHAWSCHGLFMMLPELRRERRGAWVENAAMKNCPKLYLTRKYNRNDKSNKNYKARLNKIEEKKKPASKTGKPYDIDYGIIASNTMMRAKGSSPPSWGIDKATSAGQQIQFFFFSSLAAHRRNPGESINVRCQHRPSRGRRCAHRLMLRVR